MIQEAGNFKLLYGVLQRPEPSDAVCCQPGAVYHGRHMLGRNEPRPGRRSREASQIIKRIYQEEGEIFDITLTSPLDNESWTDDC